MQHRLQRTFIVVDTHSTMENHSFCSNLFSATSCHQLCFFHLCIGLRLLCTVACIATHALWLIAALGICTSFISYWGNCLECQFFKEVPLCCSCLHAAWSAYLHLCVLYCHNDGMIITEGYYKIQKCCKCFWKVPRIAIAIKTFIRGIITEKKKKHTT